MMYIKEVLLQQFINLFDKKLLVAVLKMKICQTRVFGLLATRELTEELRKPIVKKLRNEKYTQLLQKIFGVLILLIFN